MGDAAKPALERDGLHAGDYVICRTASMSTDDHLDSPENRERARQKEEDARTSQHDGCAPPPRPLVAPAEEPVLPLGEGGDVDASIEAARARLRDKDDLPMPIVLRDPLTGKPIGDV